HDRDPDDNGIYDEGNGVTTRVSVRSSGGEANNHSRFPSISADGVLVVFASDAINMVGLDTNGKRDVFLHDRSTAKTTRISLSSAGVQSNGLSDTPAIAAGGGFVAFRSDATNLVSGDTNNFADVFVRDLANATTTRVSVDSLGVEGNGVSIGP